MVLKSELINKSQHLRTTINKVYTGKRLSACLYLVPSLEVRHRVEDKVKKWFTDRDSWSLLFSSVQICDGHMGTFPLQEELCVIFTLFTYSVAAAGCWIHYNHTGLRCCGHVAGITKLLVCLASLATWIHSCFLIWSEVSLVFVLCVGIVTVSDVSLTVLLSRGASNGSALMFGLVDVALMVIPVHRGGPLWQLLPHAAQVLPGGGSCVRTWTLPGIRPRSPWWDHAGMSKIKSSVHTLSVWHFGQVFWFWELQINQNPLFTAVLFVYN